MNNQRTVIHFTHIPKCGGTSFKKGLEEIYKDRVCFYYFNPLRHQLMARLRYRYFQLRTFFKPDKFLTDFDIVYGHVSLNHIYFDETVSVKRAAFFREPIDWLGSFYFYHKDKYPDEITDDIIALVHNMDLGNAFQKYLGRYTVDDLDFVGITEHYEQSLALYQKMFGVTIPFHYQNKTSNAPPNYREYFAQHGMLEKISNLMKNNTVIYEQALKRFEQLR